MNPFFDPPSAGTEPAAKLAALYLAVQGLLGATWWIWLWAEPDAWRLFWPVETPPLVRLSFFLPDMIMFVLASLLAAAGIAMRRAWARAAAWMVAGAVGYAALMCVAATALSGEAVAASASMVAAFLGSFCAAQAARG